MEGFKMLRPDSKGRITLGALAKGVSGFRVFVDEDQRIVLEPYTEIPAREKWLFDNPQALNQVRKGLADSAAGKTKTRGSFVAFAGDDDG